MNDDSTGCDLRSSALDRDDTHRGRPKVACPPFPSIYPRRIRHPRIRRAEISRIILGGGERYLSPERRLDAMIVNSPNLFS